MTSTLDATATPAPTPILLDTRSAEPAPSLGRGPAESAVIATVPADSAGSPADPATGLGRRPADLVTDIQPGDRWLVVVAHPDDESFGTGSLVAHAAARGAHVAIVCATRGEAGSPTPIIPAGVALGPLREFELRAAAYLLGTGDVELLDHRDSDFEGPLHPDALCAFPVADLAAEIRSHLDRVRPHVVLVLDGSDGHRDHRHVRAATIEAFATAGPGSVGVATEGLCSVGVGTEGVCSVGVGSVGVGSVGVCSEGVGSVGVDGAALYEHCLPNALMRRWLDEMRSSGHDTAYHQIDPATLGRADDEVTHVIDVRSVRSRRDAAIAMHRSQTSPFEHLSPELRHAFLGTDHLALVATRP